MSPINTSSVIVRGRWLAVAAIRDEDWQEGELLPTPREFIDAARRHAARAPDIFTFAEKVDAPMPRFDFYYDYESIATIPVLSYRDWWTNRLQVRARQDVTRAAKRGVVVRGVPFDDELVRGIVKIYDETPIRQGRPFWHYGRGFQYAKEQNATYRDRSEFLGAFDGGELIGFLKLVYVGRTARLMQILAKESHRDKRPVNALIAKAVELCEQRGKSHLIYGNYQYRQGADSLTAFKHRTGFEEILVPRYYVPLTAWGGIAIRLGIHRGAAAIIPAAAFRFLRSVRSAVYRAGR